MIPFFPYGFLLAAAQLALTDFWMRRRGDGLRRRLQILAWGAYGWLLLALVVFPLPADCGSPGSNVEWILSRVNLRPFFYGEQPILHAVVADILGNLLLTFPAGAMLGFSSISKRWITAWAGLMGIGLEGLQLAVSLGLGCAYRAVDINDMLLNVAGVWLGAGLVRLVRLKMALRRSADSPANPGQ